MQATQTRCRNSSQEFLLSYEAFGTMQNCTDESSLASNMVSTWELSIQAQSKGADPKRASLLPT